MIISGFYFFCFFVLLLDKSFATRLLAIFGMTHIVAENSIYFWTLNHPQFFDFTLYLLMCWFLDILLIFFSACILKGWRKKLTLFVVVPTLFSQMLAMQYPLLLPGILSFVVNSSYATSMEMIILCASFKDNTIKEWIKTGLVMSSLVLARFVPYLMH